MDHEKIIDGLMFEDESVSTKVLELTEIVLKKALREYLRSWQDCSLDQVLL